MTNENESKRSKTSQKIDSRKFQFLQKIDSISISIPSLSFMAVRQAPPEWLGSNARLEKAHLAEIFETFFFCNFPEVFAKFNENFRRNGRILRFFSTISTSNFDSFQFVLFTFSDNFQIDILVCFQIECQWVSVQEGSRVNVEFSAS